MVRARVVHTVGASHCTWGRPATGRGIGAPVRPPVVWVNRAPLAVISGSALISGNPAGWNVTSRCGAPPDPGAGDVPAAGVPGAGDAAILDLDPGREVVGEPEPFGRVQLFQVLEHIRRRVIVVRRASGKPGPEQSGDRF